MWCCEKVGVEIDLVCTQIYFDKDSDFYDDIPSINFNRNLISNWSIKGFKNWAIFSPEIDCVKRKVERMVKESIALATPGNSLNINR